MNRLPTETVPAEPTFSVVIPCFNEAQHVGGLLADLQHQTEPPYAVVVGDCMSEDGTVQIAEQFKASLPLQIVQSAKRSPAAARNSATAALDCHPEDYLVFVDADERLPKTFLAQIRSVIREHPVDFITPAFASDGQHWADTLAVRQVNATNRRTITRQHKVAGIGGAMIVRKSMHDKVGGFPEDVAQDDMGYVARLNAVGATAYYAGDITVINSSRRLRKEGTLRWLLGVLPEQSVVTRAISRIVRRDITKRAYGHYNRTGH